MKLTDMAQSDMLASRQEVRPTLLVVDDQPENIDVLSNILRDDYRIKAATNGENALQILQDTGKDLPDLILLDIMMPGKDGYEVCKVLKQNDRTRNIPIIFVSALQDVTDRVRAFSTGGVDYIAKPVQPEEVKARVHAHIQIKNMQEQLENANIELEERVKERTIQVETAYNELHESFRQIVESEVKYRSLLEAAPDAVVLTNQKGEIEMINPVGEEMLGYSSEELLGKSVDILVPPRFSSHTKLRENYMRDPFHVEIMKQSGFYALHKSGKEIPIDLRLNPLETNDGVKFIAVLRDMTSQEQLQQQLQQAQKMEAIGHLTGGIAHDFNNMLASILGFTQLAMEIGDEHKDEKLNEYLGEVNLAGERARDLISQMLSFSRRNSEKQYVKLKLSILVKEVVSLIRPMLPSSIDINYDEGKDVPSINADPVKMHQVLMNLCINARDAVAGHGKIEVLLDKLTVNDEICSSCHSNFSGDYVVLTVADDGEGIDEQHLDKVFDPFYTTKEVGKGTGMGLSVVHGIMHDHRGHIIVKTAKGKGTTFTLLFPLIKDE